MNNISSRHPLSLPTMGISLNQEETFTRLVHGDSSKSAPLPQASHIQIATMDHGTLKGLPLAVISFNVEMPDGSVRPAQAVTTVALLASLGAALKGRYDTGGPAGTNWPNGSPFV